MTTTRQRTFSATFRNLKLAAMDHVEIVKCELEVELRSTHGDPQRFFAFWKHNGRPIHGRAVTLVKAQHTVARMFEEQVSQWRRVDGERE